MEISSLPALEKAGFAGVSRLPFSLKILLENLLRREDDAFVKADDIRALAEWNATGKVEKEISFMPARVLLQDFTGVPCVVDLAAMRDAVVALGGDPDRINPLRTVELVIDHSVQVDYFGRADAFALNAELEFSRNRERYAFLRWGQQAFHNFKVVPPDTGIVHQVNIEHLARVVCSETVNGKTVAYPDTLVGTDSHTTMVNGLGVVGWGVGGIEAEAAMLGQPSSMLIPEVLGVRLTGAMPRGVTATDLVLLVTEVLRKQGVVGKFVEFFGEGLSALTIADRATLGNMCPEYGATVAIFPIDDMTLEYLRLTGRDDDRVALVEAYAKEQGLFRTAASPDAVYSQTIEVNLEKVEPCLAGPKRPQDRVLLKSAKSAFATALPSMQVPAKGAKPAAAAAADRGRRRRSAGRARSRLRRDCRDYELHQHLEPERDDRRRPAGQEGGGTGPHAQAVGEEQSRAGIEGGDRVSRLRRPVAVPRSARVQPGGLRLHHLHRQQRPAARRHLGGDPREEPGRRLGAERQPQLRGPHPAGGARQLPGVAAARRGLCAGRHHHHRPHDRAARHHAGRQGHLPEGHLADRAGNPDHDGEGGHGRHVPPQLREGL